MYVNINAVDGFLIYDIKELDWHCNVEFTKLKLQGNYWLHRQVFWYRIGSGWELWS